jgi:hypothetical protein
MRYSVSIIVESIDDDGKQRLVFRQVVLADHPTLTYAERVVGLMVELLRAGGFAMREERD